MEIGTVKWWNDSKGYGAISTHGRKDIIAHYTGIVDPGGTGFKTCAEGELVGVVFTGGERLTIHRINVGLLLSSGGIVCRTCALASDYALTRCLTANGTRFEVVSTYSGAGPLFCQECNGVAAVGCTADTVTSRLSPAAPVKLGRRPKAALRR